MIGTENYFIAYKILFFLQNSIKSTLNILAITSYGDSVYNKTAQTVNSKHVFFYSRNSTIIMVVCYSHRMCACILLRMLAIYVLWHIIV